MEKDLHLIEWLRRVQLTWELDLSKLSTIAHVSEAVLKQYLASTPEQIEAFPSIPAGLEPAVALIGVFRRIQGVYPTAEEQNHWLTNPNSVFEGNKPIDVMAMSPDHLAYVSYAVESGLTLV